MRETYSEDTKSKIMEVLKLFFQLEQGNRVTIFNTSGLVTKVEQTFRECEQKSDKKGKIKR